MYVKRVLFNKKSLILYLFLIPLSLLGYAFTPLDNEIRQILGNLTYVKFQDRNGKALNISYNSRWNIHDYLYISQIPPLLIDAFVISEDKRFYEHSGVDWLAKLNAIQQILWKGAKKRGASSITEQTIRLIHPRSRNLFSKTIEVLESIHLESQLSKTQIFEFYLNEIPYAANRRGVQQAARYYFNRDLSTLSDKELLSLVILARAPSSYDLFKDQTKIQNLISKLAAKLEEAGKISQTDLEVIRNSPLTLEKGNIVHTDVSHFLNYLKTYVKFNDDKLIRTTLDSNLQNYVQKILDNRIASLKVHNIKNGAAIVLNHQTGEVLAWIVAKQDTNTNDINAALVPRQAGSTLKPFLYASALEKGWTAATIIEDEPTTHPIRNGLHTFHNYSRTHYGKVTLREALGNSLNIPAIKTINFVGAAPFLEKLNSLGITNLNESAMFYDEGLALGSGEISLRELMQAYFVLANRGIRADMKYILNQGFETPTKQIYSKEVVSIISNILSDSNARKLEFSTSSILNFPIQTAVKTGTSTNFKDAWAFGYNSKYLVGIWIGNLDNQPMIGVTGSTGPALALRSIFKYLNQNEDLQPLYLSPNLIKMNFASSGDTNCGMQSEYFIEGTKSKDDLQTINKIIVLQPTSNLNLAIDPRIPIDKQKFAFKLSGIKDGDEVIWTVDAKHYPSQSFNWPLSIGTHIAQVAVSRDKQLLYKSALIKFFVN